ncbi:hypothetical protein NDU88_003876 [Pleurodeles waltl]|uniref:Uncharacterized protein n=1 Tax=Pleurodeles waltl TaxID=8319 RepID=A0AAV7UHM5_PLEWA|nr:hypothetical protein NDU88_003876 [Pleurodeles waltl]
MWVEVAQPSRRADERARAERERIGGRQSMDTCVREARSWSPVSWLFFPGLLELLDTTCRKHQPTPLAGQAVRRIASRRQNQGESWARRARRRGGPPQSVQCQGASV